MERKFILVDDNGAIAQFLSPTWGGRDAIYALLRTSQARGGKLFPVVTLSSERRENSRGGSNDRPLFKVVDWTDPSNFSHIVGDLIKSAESVASCAAPKQIVERREDAYDEDHATSKRPLDDIVDDDIPF
jgi:hypothetical protein